MEQGASGKAKLTNVMLYVIVGLSVFLLLFIGLVCLLCIRKVHPGKAGLSVGLGGLRVAFDYMIRIPIVQNFEEMDISVKKLEIHRKGKDGLVCADNIRADITVAFYIRVDANEESVRKVAQMLTPDRVSDLNQLRELFEAKFSEALKTAGKQMKFHELFTERIKFRDQIQATIGKDLDGFLLQDVAIDYLEQTPLEQHDPSNVLDAEGIKKITEITQRERVISNEFTQRAQVQVEKENADADIAKREQRRRNGKIRGREETASTPIIAISATTTAALHERARANGCDDVLTKPVNFRLLARCIETLLGVTFIREPANALTDSGLRRTIEPLSEEDLKSLPSDWLRRMYVASATASPDGVPALILEITDAYPAIAEKIVELMNTFNLSQIADQIERVLNQER